MCEILNKLLSKYIEPNISWSTGFIFNLETEFYLFDSVKIRKYWTRIFTYIKLYRIYCKENKVYPCIFEKNQMFLCMYIFFNFLYAIWHSFFFNYSRWFFIWKNLDIPLPKAISWNSDLVSIATAIISLLTLKNNMNLNEMVQNCRTDSK